MTEQDPREVLRDYVTKHGLKLTRQRELIANVFFAAEGHLKVEGLLERVREKDPNVSLATVYRTMKLLTECGLAAPHRFGDTSVVYEPADHDDEHHDHLICTKCGKIVEFFNEKIEVLQNAVAAEHGYQVTHHRMELYGLCRDCRG
jgi:Fur family ferric uptake transcriptional regulator